MDNIKTIKYPFDVNTLVKVFSQMLNDPEDVALNKGFNAIISKSWGIYSYREEDGNTIVTKPCAFLYDIANAVGNCQITTESGEVLTTPETRYFINREMFSKYMDEIHKDKYIKGHYKTRAGNLRNTFEIRGENYESIEFVFDERLSLMGMRHKVHKEEFFVKMCDYRDIFSLVRDPKLLQRIYDIIKAVNPSLDVDIVQMKADKARIQAANKVYLNVPFAEKDTAKGLGARWDSDAKRWFYYKDSVANEKDFDKWRQKTRQVEKDDDL